MLNQHLYHGFVLSLFIVLGEFAFLFGGIMLLLNIFEFSVIELAIGGALLLVLLAIVLFLIDRKTKVRKLRGYLTLLSSNGKGISYKLTRARTQKWQVSGIVDFLNHIDIELKEDARQHQAQVFVSVYGTDGFVFWSQRRLDEGDVLAIGPDCRLARNQQK